MKPGGFSQILYFVAAGLIVLALPRDQNLDFRQILFIALIVVTLSRIGRWIQIGKRKSIQDNRDEEAIEIIQKLRDRKKIVYFLYLRPFKIDNRLEVENMGYEHEPWVPQSYGEFPSFAFEAVLVENLNRLCRTIALGKSGKALGFGRFYTEDNTWKRYFKFFAYFAKIIFIIPSYTSNTVWEINWLKKKNLLYKCIFIMPRQHDSNKLNIPKFWNITSKVLEIYGVILPSYHRDGLFFTINNKDGNIEKALNLTSNPIPLIKMMLDKLPNPIFCPNCEKEISLSETCRKSWYFCCAVCSKNIDLVNGRNKWFLGFNLENKKAKKELTHPATRIELSNVKKCEMVCPRCLLEFLDGFTECPRCKVPLVESLPEQTEAENDDQILDYLETFSTSNPAEIAVIKSILNHKGVNYYLQGENIVNINLWVQPVKLFVREDQVKIVRNLLEEF